jgi:VIT1/CCC1 family predicted Fe2+/Mn2+ transporter
MADGRSDDPIRDDPATDSGADEEIGAPRDSGGRADSAPRAPGPGARLRAARKASGLDQDEMARALNLSRRVIRALEEDDDEQLPGATFVRGYIRSWARLTGESEEPLLAAFASAVSFSIGALPPLLIVLFAPIDLIGVYVSVATIFLLAILGALGAKAGGAPLAIGALRVMFWGGAAMGATAIVGKLFHVAVV